MNLHQQLILQRIEKTAQDLGLPEDLAFIRFTHSLIVGKSMHSFDEDDLIDGSQEKQIDCITIEEDEDNATVYIFQFKNSDSFSSNTLILMRNGLEWIFNKSQSDIKQLSNLKFKDRILEYRTLQRELGPSNLKIFVIYVTMGISASLSEEFKQEIKTINDQYDNNTFAEFQLQIWGAEELVGRMNAIEKNDRKIDADIRINYDANNPSLIKYYHAMSGLRGVVCTTTAQEIARIVNNDSTGSIFDLNIRRFLGTRGRVNADILRTCQQSDSSYLFWFLNNGITIICDRIDPVTDPDNPVVKIENMQIVNGCQTATALALAAERGILARDVKILLRIYQTTDSDLVSKIVMTTNNQNEISSRDLRANDPIQVDMERALRHYGYFYERKLRQYDNSENIDTNRIIDNESLAQSYLSIVMRKPSDARARKYKIWSNYYNQIFGGSEVVEPFIISYMLYKYTENWLKISNLSNDLNNLKRTLSKKGAFHIARIASFLWKGNDNWDSKSNNLGHLVDILENHPSSFDGNIEMSFSILEKIINGDKKFSSDLESALKSSNLDTEIDRELHTKSAPKEP